MLRLWHPEVYQGGKRKRRYFEGYYAKHVSSDLSESWAFILAISHGEVAAEDLSFIQVIEGRTGKTWWFEGPPEDFEGSTSDFRIRVGRSEISWEGAVIDIDRDGTRFKGEIRYGPARRLDSSLLSPGVMGWFGLMPFMECKHGLVSLDHSLEGGFSHDGRRVDLDGGRGYIEKDWGSSMPSAWIWTQSNNFAEPGDSFMLSIAEVPWLGSSFVGFLLVASLGGQILRMATYTGARLQSLEGDNSAVHIRIVQGETSLDIGIQRAKGGELRAPVKGRLSRRISESVDASLSLRFVRKGRLLFEGQAPKAGLEVVGDLARLLPRSRPGA
jgi:tocopherol cyclase